MNHPMSRGSRRAFMATVATSAAFFTVKGAYAEQLAATPERTEGPFYPDRLPLDTDNDLIIINDSITPAVGEITHLSGRILGPRVRHCVTSRSRSGSATPNRCTCTPATAMPRRTSRTRTSRASAALPLARPASTVSAPSSPFLTPDGLPLTFISR